jgi:hypothetical protein
MTQRKDHHKPCRQLVMIGAIQCDSEVGADTRQRVKVRLSLTWLQLNGLGNGTNASPCQHQHTTACRFTSNHASINIFPRSLAWASMVLSSSAMCPRGSTVVQCVREDRREPYQCRTQGTLLLPVNRMNPKSCDYQASQALARPSGSYQCKTGQS